MIAHANDYGSEPSGKRQPDEMLEKALQNAIKYKILPEGSTVWNLTPEKGDLHELGNA